MRNDSFYLKTMHKYDFIKRFKNMERVERSLRVEEELLKKTTIKFYMNLTNTQEAIQQQMLDMPSEQQLKSLIKLNECLKLITQKIETNIERHKADILKLQKDHDQLTETMEDQRERLFLLKETTNVFLNTRSSDLQGMNVCCVEQNYRYIPFSIPINNLTQEQIPQLFWTATQNSNDYSQQWEELIFGKSN